jgi:hypothetical protein
MHMKTCTCIWVTAFAITSTSAALAQEQPWLQDRQYNEGMGVRVGDLELHPGAALEVGYDSNFFLRAGGEEEPLVPALRFRPTAHLSLSTLSPQRRHNDQNAAPPKLNFRAGLALVGNLLAPLDSGDGEYLKRHNDVGAGVNFKTDILPQKPWGGDFSGEE